MLVHLSVSARSLAGLYDSISSLMGDVDGFRKKCFSQVLRQMKHFLDREQEECHCRWRTLPGHRQWAAC